MDESIQQVPQAVTSSFAADASVNLVTSGQRIEDKQQQQQQQHHSTTAAILREAGDRLESQNRTMNLVAMVDCLNSEKAIQDHLEHQETISKQQVARQGQTLITVGVLGKQAPPAPQPPNGATDPATLNQQTDHHELLVKNPAIDDGGAGSNSSTFSGPKPKQNGLKNRQRPPPLVLDKVSNFYDNVTNSSIVQPQQRPHQREPSNLATQPNSRVIDDKTLETSKSDSATQQDAKNHQAKQQQKQPATNLNQLGDSALISSDQRSTNNNNINNANQKFWASLNENASRNRALSNARGLSAVAVATSATTTLSEPPYATGNFSSISLGPDLVIKQRNISSGSISSSRVVSTLAARKQHQHQDQPYNQINASHSLEDTLRDTTNQYRVQQYQNVDEQQQQHRDADGVRLNQSDDIDEADNNAGGNLIGVEQIITPPVHTDSSRINHQDQNTPDDPPPSATSSRPRSNNPFLDDNDEDFEEYRNSIRSQSANRDSFSSQDNNNFQKRPASFIAATERMYGFQKPSSNYAAKQKIVEEKLSELQVNESAQSVKQPNQMTQQHQIIHAGHTDQPDSQAKYQAFHLQQQGQVMMATHYKTAANGVIYGSNNNDSFVGGLNEPKISLASESAVCQPPPSATMLLSHWSDAVYELNNAILEASSIAGGAENGQFIHIIESGDIILELDQVEVSGFTLLEFNDLVESKQFHLLKAVQTKHSHGLTLNLKDYLALSFPKNSKDKKLQSVIRDNIYRQTIPCTTRQPKSGELDKVDYYFLTKEQFMELNKQGALIECGIYVGHYYGTLRPLCDIDQLLSNLPQVPRHDSYQVKVRRAWDANHPAVEMIMKKDATLAQSTDVNHDESPLYENHESLGMQQPQQRHAQLLSDIYMPINTAPVAASQMASINLIPSPHVNETGLSRLDDALPPGWERVTDQTHGTYYIDHNTQRTQYEQPYEVELTKSSMGFGFTLVEADSGLLLVRSVIPGGPAHLNGLIRPGDILISAVGVSVTGLQHTDIARLFSTFAIGDRVRLTFGRSNYVLNENIVPDEYLFSNGTNGDLAIAVNPNNYQLNQQDMVNENNPHILVNQEFEFIKVTLKRGDQGFGFTISDSIAGQKVRKIQNHEICSNLKQGDILINLNNEDITKMTHKEVVERLKNCPPGDDVTLTIKRKKRFRSKTPMAMHKDASGEFSLDTPQRNCKTPSLDGLMLRHPANYDLKAQSSVVARSLFQPLNNVQLNDQQHPLLQDGAMAQPLHVADMNVANGLPTAASDQQPYSSLNLSQVINGGSGGPPQQLYDENMLINSQQTPGQVDYRLNHHHHPFLQSHIIPTSNQTINDLIPTQAPHTMRPNSNQSPNVLLYKDMNVSNSLKANSEASFMHDQRHHSTAYHSTNQPRACNDYNQVNNQYNNFMNNDKLMMMQMQQQQQQPSYQQQIYSSSDYHRVPLYSNSDVITNNNELGGGPMLPIKQPMTTQYWQPGGVVPAVDDNNFQSNLYANNDEIAMQSLQYGYVPTAAQMRPPPAPEQFTFPVHQSGISHETPHDEHDEFEYHQVDLERENTDANWGIRLIGGSEANRAISIGSMIFGGVAAKSSKLKSGDEIISVDGVNVQGAKHVDVVNLISACRHRVSLVVRRKTFAEACDVVLTKNLDEGFGFVIISNENCALIGKIIEGSPADRCKQLRVRDCIIAVNGRYITPDMKHPEIVNMIKDCGSTLRLRIIPVDCYTVKLIKDVRNDSFGFRMRGGSEYDGTPLYIVRVEPNGQAQDLLNVGDQILEINNIPTVGMTHQQAATIIKYSDPIVKLKLRRNYVTPPSLLVDSPRSLLKYNQTAEMKQVILASTPTNIQPSSNDNSFTSLPSNVNLMNQKFQQPLRMPSYLPDRPQSIYDCHSMSYVDQSTLYAI